MNNNLRLDELWTDLSNRKNKKNHGFAKKTFMHNCIIQMPRPTHPIKSRFPKKNMNKKNSDMIHIRVFLFYGGSGFIYCPRTTYLLLLCLLAY